jgi:hypothetical protein
MVPSTAKSAVAPLIEPYCSEKVDLPELGPVNVFEHKLAVGRLPEQESAQTFLS